MRLATSPHLLQTSREEREAKLREFVAESLDLRRSPTLAESNCFTLVARCPDSPVCCALASLAGDLAAANITIRAMMLDLDGLSEDMSAKSSLLDMPNVEIRLLQDPRFASAHEQLVLGSNRVWLGDCMRRDPSKRDAFEMFHDQNTTAATHAIVSFSRLWAGALTLPRVKAVTADFVLAGQMQADAAPQSAPRR